MTEFEGLYQNIVSSNTELPNESLSQIKTKLRNSCEKYSKIKTPSEDEQTIKNLSKNTNIKIIKQDKGRGVIIMDTPVYQEKCLTILNTQQFIKLNNDPTKSTEGKIQRAIRNVKSKIIEQDYKKIYPTGSSPGRFYATAKLHKMPENDNDIKNLPIRPIISNINTASYDLAKYLSKILTPLSTSEFTVKNSEDFIIKFKNQIVPTDYKIISFDVVSLFTSIPLDYTIDLILRRIYVNKEIATEIPKKDMKTLLLLCTKQVHFTFNDEIYTQKDGVAMGSPIGPILSNIFMVDLETTVLPTLTSYMTNWKRYVDDTICYINENAIENVLTKLNSHHSNIKFTYEKEKDNKISFLDVLIERSEGTVTTSVFHKKTNSDIYLHWNSYAPTNWKRGTLRTLIQRAHRICSDRLVLNKEIEYIRRIFKVDNGYPEWVINDVINKVEEKINSSMDISPMEEKK